MKCGTLVRYVERKRKKKGGGYTTRLVADRWVTPWHQKVEEWSIDYPNPTHPDWKKEDFIKCDGDIVASIEAVDEPDWGCSYASLRIDYKCNKCGASYFPELPQDSESLSKLVTEAIVKITKKQRAEALAKGLKQKKETDARMKEMNQQLIDNRKKVAENKKKRTKKKEKKK